MMMYIFETWGSEENAEEVGCGRNDLMTVL